MPASSRKSGDRIAVCGWPPISEHDVDDHGGSEWSLTTEIAVKTPGEREPSEYWWAALSAYQWTERSIAQLWIPYPHEDDDEEIADWQYGGRRTIPPQVRAVVDEVRGKWTVQTALEQQGDARAFADWAGVRWLPIEQPFADPTAFDHSGGLRDKRPPVSEMRSLMAEWLDLLGVQRGKSYYA